MQMDRASASRLMIQTLSRSKKCAASVDSLYTSLLLNVPESMPYYGDKSLSDCPEVLESCRCLVTSCVHIHSYFQ
jgi:hypothetical protein